MTSIKLVFVNIPFGLGMDLAFGKSKVGFGIDSDIGLDGLPSGITQTSKGSLSVNGGTSANPRIANLKLMTGLGFLFGPAYLDIPFTYYFRDKGISLGATIGISF
jgi:hypothetical protein